jgi:hypothetical protein
MTRRERRYFRTRSGTITMKDITHFLGKELKSKSRMIRMAQQYDIHMGSEYRQELDFYLKQVYENKNTSI